MKKFVSGDFTSQLDSGIKIQNSILNHLGGFSTIKNIFPHFEC